ncbi:MAG: PQQ-binding-like beta-propeller repeat protein [Planctomycetota bacterium]
MTGTLKQTTPTLGIFLAIGLICASANADNWGQWRGPMQSSISSETGLGDDWASDNQLWRVDMPGPGGASPVVWDNRLFVTSVDGEGSNGDPMTLVCYSVEDGSVLWKTELEGANQNSRDGATSASPSPATDGEHVWAQGTAGVLHCFTVEGELVWKKDLQAEYGEFQIQFGMTSTPVLDEGRLYLQLIHGEMKRGSTETSKGHVIALDAETGDEIWRHLRETEAYFENLHSYASPLVYRDSDHSFLVTHGADYAIAHSLDDGSELWRCGGLNPVEDYNPFLRLVASPVFMDGIIIIPSAKRGPVVAVKPDGSGDITDNEAAHLWRTESSTPDVSCPLIYEGTVYLTRENGVLTCLDAETGERTFEERLFRDNHRSTPVAAGDKIFVTTRDGKLLVLRAGAEPEVAAEIDLGEDTTASPAISNGRVFVRTAEGLYAFGNK